MNDRSRGIININLSEELPEGLGERIFSAIEQRRSREAKMRFVLITIIALSSSLALIPATRYLIRAFSESGFIQYASLIFSDSTAVLSSWQTFTLSLLESLPVMELIVSLSIVFVLLESIRFAAKNARLAFPHSDLSVLKYR